MKTVVKGFKGIIAVVLMITVLLSGFSTKAQAATVKLNKTNISVQKGKTYQLKIKGTSSKVSWSSSNKKIATVSSSGKVTSVDTGTTTITAKVSGKSYKATVKVVDALSKKDFIVKVKDYPEEGKTGTFDFIKESKDQNDLIYWSDDTSTFTASRGIKNGSSASAVQKAFGTTSYKDYSILTTPEIVQQLLDQNDVSRGNWKQFVEYTYIYKKVDYRIFFYFDEDKKVSGMLMIKNIDAFG